MKYRYKNTSAIVESDRVLDSTIFTLISDEPPKAEATAETTKKTAKRTAGKR